MKPKQLQNEAEQLQPWLVQTRRYLHQHAEIGFQLKQTFAFVKKELEDMGYQPQKCGKSGLVAYAGGQTKGRVFLLRSDMDALPIAEQTSLDYACPNQNMHACGHDMHTAMLLGAAKLLKMHETEIEGTIALMFQPAEEIFEGSRDMIADGLLKNPDVDCALMIHVMSAMPIPAGTVLVSAPGVSAPAADLFEIHVQGVGCHGSMPNTGVDPLNAAAHILIALQELSARELAINEQAALTIGTIHAGTAANVIADSVTMGGSLRTYDEELRTFLKERMQAIAQHTAAAFRATASITFQAGCPTLTNDADLSTCIKNYVVELLGSEKTISVADLNRTANGTSASKSAGSEDFAYVSQEVPSLMLALAAGEPDKGYTYPQHHPMVTFDESVLSGGSAVYAYTALRWLAEHH